MPDANVKIDEVKALRTQSGKTRFVLVDDSGKEYTTFKEPIARDAIAAEGRRARIEYHEEDRNGFHNVYLDRVEPLEEIGQDGDQLGDISFGGEPGSDSVSSHEAMEAEEIPEIDSPLDE